MAAPVPPRAGAFHICGPILGTLKYPIGKTAYRWLP
jgi:hypothetical protein